MPARGTPDARFVALEGTNHLTLSHEPAWVRFINEVCGVLGEDEPQRLTAAVSLIGAGSGEENPRCPRCGLPFCNRYCY